MIKPEEQNKIENNKTPAIIPEKIEKKEISPEKFVEIADAEKQNFKQETTDEISKLNSVHLDKQTFENIKNETGVEIKLNNLNQDAEKIIEDSKNQVNNLGIKIEERNNLSENQNKDNKSLMTLDPLEYFDGDKNAAQEHFRNLSMEFATVMPVEKSVVRIEQQNQILNDLESGIPVVVEAYWRQGKTSMLKSLGNEWKKKNELEPIYIDVSTKEYAWKKLSNEEFQKELGKDKIESFIEDNFPDISVDNLSKEMDDKTAFQALDALMGRQGKQVLIELDELIYTAEKNDGRLQTLMENLKNLKNVKTLVAWHPLDTLSDKAESAYKDYKKVSIKPLNFEDTKKLIEKPLKDMASDVSFSNEAIQKIYDYTGGRPMDINLFCGQLTGGINFDAIQKMRYEKKDIDEFINKNNLNETYNAANGFSATCVNIPKIYEYFLNNEHKDAITTLVKGGGEMSISNISEKSAMELMNLGLIIKNEKNNTYKINGELAFNLLKEKIENS